MESSQMIELQNENISNREENKLIEKKEVIEKRQENTVAVVTNYIVENYYSSDSVEQFAM